ncbi:hypothetical protein PCANC_14854 [Puccinia coronata f. sp. avenae]|uniref:Uncharacterized protein n=1 Tax=Puccinia coronata f. sp. avenae TaxID=200324 RepID=A0A2N5UI69_9BASI|nr:hypothetical protein PCANC_14854 [Puccinia coronata f. sp. avenae]
MPSNSNSTPSPKQRNRFISTLRRTLRPHTQPASPNTPPPFGKTKIRSVFPSDLVTPTHHLQQAPDLVTCPPLPLALLAPLSQLRNSVVMQLSSLKSDSVRCSLAHPVPHHADQSSDFPSSSSPLRSCFQEVFDLLDAGIIDQQIEYLGPDTSYQLSSNFLEPSTPDATLDIPHIGRLDEPLELPLARITATQTCLPTPCASLSESLFDPTRGGTEHESIDLLPASISDSLENLPEIGMSDELSDISGAAKSNKSVQEANGSEVLENPIEDADTIQTFLYTLSAALRSDPTEFSPRVSEWNRESIDFSWLQSEDQINLHPLLPSHQVTLQTLPSSNLQQETHLPKFLKRSTARAKKNNLLKFQTSNTSRIFSL